MPSMSIVLEIMVWSPFGVSYSAPLAAFSISAATSLACDRNMTWLPVSSIVSDLARRLMNRSSSGLIMRSCVETVAKLGFLDHAGVVTLASNDEPAIGTCEMDMKCATDSGTSRHLDSGHYVVATLQQKVGNCGANALECSSHNDGLLVRSHPSLLPLVLCCANCPDSRRA